MATCDFPNAKVFTGYQGSNHSFAGPSKITSITDGSNTNQEFTKGESLTITLDVNGTVSTQTGWIFQGTTTAIDGGPYIVLQKVIGSNTWTYVLDSGVTKVTGQTLAGSEKHAPPTVSGLNVDDSTFTVCFFPGTLIATPSGERKVEELVAGDPVLVEDAGSTPATRIGRMARRLRSKLGFVRAVPVKWVGRQTVSTLFGPAERLMPVRFASGSLGGGGGSPFCRIAT